MICDDCACIHLYSFIQNLPVNWKERFYRVNNIVAKKDFHLSVDHLLI